MGGNISSSRGIIDDLFTSLPLRRKSLASIINDFNYEYDLEVKQKKGRELKFMDQAAIIESEIEETQVEEPVVGDDNELVQDEEKSEDEDSLMIDDLMEREIDTREKKGGEAKVSGLEQGNKGGTVGSLSTAGKFGKPTPTPGGNFSTPIMEVNRKSINNKDKNPSQKSIPQVTETSKKGEATVHPRSHWGLAGTAKAKDSTPSDEYEVRINVLTETRFQYMYNDFGIGSNRKFAEALHLYWYDLYNSKPYEKQVFYTVFQVMLLSHNNSISNLKTLSSIYAKFVVKNMPQDEKSKYNKKAEATVEDLFELIYNYIYCISYLCIDKIKYYTKDPHSFQSQFSKIWGPEIIKSFCRETFFESESKWHSRLDLEKFFEKFLPLLQSDSDIRKRLTEYGLKIVEQTNSSIVFKFVPS